MERIMNAQLNFTATPQLVEALDTWRSGQPDRPTRNEAVRRLLSEAILFGSSLRDERDRARALGRGDRV
jgi:hypothetical protein